MRILEEPAIFLREHYVDSGLRSSEATWKKAAEELKHWLEFLRALNVDWRIASRDDLIMWRHILSSTISPHTHEPYASSTVATRMMTVMAFYRFAATEGWYFGDLAEEPAKKRVPIDQDMLAHTRKGQTRARFLGNEGLSSLLPKVRAKKYKIKPISINEWRRIQPHLGPMPSDLTGDALANGLSGRNRLLCEIALWTGLRLDEVHRLTIHDFLVMTPDKQISGGNQRLDVIKGKGNRPRIVLIPNWLVLEVLAYINGERASVLAASDIKRRNYPTSLFLAGSNSQRAGQPMTKRRYEQIFEAACMKAGIVEFTEKTDPETLEVRHVKEPAHTYHDLRHSYAVWTYWAERKAGNSEPWKKIQVQLGHKSLQTTIDTYLHFVELFDGLEVPIDVRSMLRL